MGRSRPAAVDYRWTSLWMNEERPGLRACDLQERYPQLWMKESLLPSPGVKSPVILGERSGEPVAPSLAASRGRRPRRGSTIFAAATSVAECGAGASDYADLLLPVTGMSVSPDSVMP